jgi:hypothetical protein
MAEFSYYGTWADSLVWLSGLFSAERFVFVVDQWHTDPNRNQFASFSDEILDQIMRRPLIYLWSDDYSTLPVLYERERQGYPRRVEPTECGPMLELSLPVEQRINNELHIAYGSLHYQPMYHDPVQDIWYKPPNRLKQSYRVVRSLLSETMVHKHVVSEMIQNGKFVSRLLPVWIGLEAFQLMRTGNAIIPREGAPIKFSDLSS